MTSSIGREPDFVTKHGRWAWINLNNYDGIKEKVITSKFDKNHHMYRTYGITDMEVHRLSGGTEYIKIYGDIFEGAKKKNFSFFASEYTAKIGTRINAQVEKFLKDIKKVRKMNISDEAIRVIKYIQ